MTEAMMALLALIRATDSIGRIIGKANAEGRDLTPEELKAVRDRRNAADAEFDELMAGLGGD